MKANKLGARILASIMILSLVFQSVAYADSQVYKEETVYVNLDNEGKDTERYSSIWLHSDTPLNKVEDRSILKEIINVKGDEEPKLINNKMVWETEEKDIYYQGKIDKKLPIKTQVKYYLDGNEVRAEDIAGESGELKIHIDIINTDSRSINLKNGEKKTAYAAYIVATAVILPMDKFDNIEMNTGKLISDGSNQILSFVSLPGLEESLNLGEDIIDLPSYLEIKADVVDFEMLPIAFTATSEIPEMESLDMAEDLDDLLKGIDSIVEASDKLNDATGKLYDGQGQLDNGIDELVNGIDKLKDGSNPLLEGSSKLKGGMDGAYRGSLDISQGTNSLSKGADELGDGFLALGDGTVEYGNKAREFSQGANKVAKGIEKIPESTSTLNEGMEELIKGTETVKNGQDDLSNGLNQSLEALVKIKAGKEKEAKLIELLLKDVDGFDNVINQLAALVGGEEAAKTMAEGLSKQKIILQGLKDSSDELIAGLSQLEEGLKQAESSSNELSSGVENINKGQKEVKYGLNELHKGTKELGLASKQLEEGSLGLKEGADTLKENAIGAKKGVNKFKQGGSELAEATNILSNGLEELKNGTDQLNKGVSEFSKGSDQLSQGGGQVKKASQEILEGSKELDKGMGEFNKEGIQKINDEVNTSNIDIQTSLEIKDELVNIAKDNKSFSGISEDMEGNLKFIMKTEGVKMEIEEDKLAVVEETENKKGFINWIKNLFK